MCINLREVQKGDSNAFPSRMSRGLDGLITKTGLLKTGCTLAAKISAISCHPGRCSCIISTSIAAGCQFSAADEVGRHLVLFVDPPIPASESVLIQATNCNIQTMFLQGMLLLMEGF